MRLNKKNVFNDEGRIIPYEVLPEFMSYLSNLGYPIEKLLDKDADWRVKIYDVPGEYPYDADLQLARAMARRDNEFREHIAKYGDEYLHGFLDLKAKRYMSLSTLQAQVKPYLYTYEKYDYATVRPVPYRSRITRFLRSEDYSKYDVCYFHDWSVWLQGRVLWFMIQGVANNLLNDLKVYYFNYDAKDLRANGWHSFEDYLQDKVLYEKEIPSKTPVQTPPAPFYEVKTMFETGTWGLRPESKKQKYECVSSEGGTRVCDNARKILFIPSTCFWRRTCSTMKDVKEAVREFIKKESLQPLPANQRFFRLSEMEKMEVINEVSEYIFHYYVDVNHVFEEDIEDAKLYLLHQEGAELHGGMHALI